MRRGAGAGGACWWDGSAGWQRGESCQGGDEGGLWPGTSPLFLALPPSWPHTCAQRAPGCHTQTAAASQPPAPACAARPPRRFSDAEVQRDAKLVSYNIVDKQSKPYIQGRNLYCTCAARRTTARALECACADCAARQLHRCCVPGASPLPPHTHLPTDLSTSPPLPPPFFPRPPELCLQWRWPARASPFPQRRSQP